MSRTGCRRFSPSPTATRCCATATSSKPAGWPTSTGATSCARSSGANCTPAPTSPPAPPPPPPPPARGMVGPDRPTSRPRPRGRSAPALLSVQGLARAGEFDDISLQVAPGEVLGIYGLMGSGRSEFLHCVYGITAPDSGSVRLKGRILPAGRPHQAIRRGLALVTEDRKATGLVLTASVADNVSLAALPALTRAGVVRRGRERALVARMVERLRIKLATPRMAVSGLSGGNQQKVVLARCLATDPLCLLCDEPTRGIDEGAKREVYALIGQFTAQGGAAIVVSSEAPELLTLSDRIAIFNKGRLAQVVAVADATQEQLLHLAS